MDDGADVVAAIRCEIEESFSGRAVGDVANGSRAVDAQRCQFGNGIIDAWISSVPSNASN
jgi:hypothetical protein